MMPEDTLSTTARATAACAGPNICTACVAFLMVTLLKRSVSGFAGRLGVTTASSLVKPSVLFANVLTKACPAWPDFDPMIRSMWATSFPSPTRDSPRKKSAAITTSRSGWGPRVSLAGRHGCGVESSVARGGVESHAVPRLRVAPTEPYRWGANLPAAPTGVKAAGRGSKTVRASPVVPRLWRPATPRRRATPAAAARNRAPRATSPSHGGRSLARGRAGHPEPPAAAGSGDARRGAAGSCALDPEGPLVGRLELPRRRAHRRGEPPLGEVALDQPQAEIVSRALRQHLSRRQSRGRAH